jgi:hypothetical protein
MKGKLCKKNPHICGECVFNTAISGSSNKIKELLQK